MSAEIGMIHLSTSWAIAITAFTALPWGVLSFSALRVRKEGNLSFFHCARMAQFCCLRQRRASSRPRSYR